MGVENVDTELSTVSSRKSMKEVLTETGESPTDENSKVLELREIVRDNNQKNVTISCENEKAAPAKKYNMVVPDGGWGWLVLFGAMLVNILIPGGAIKSFGILFVEFIEAMPGTTPTQASWIPAICYFLYSSLGPLSSILSVRYSYRTVTLIGGAFASVGMILTYWATSINYLYVSYGTFVGIGAGLSFPPTVYIVTSYFSKKRGLANGLCISGSALGSIILPPVLRYLLDEFGYRGACLIMGGITMNVFLAALFYDPVEKHLIREEIMEEEMNELEKIDEELENDEELIDPKVKRAKFIFSHDDTPVSTPTMEREAFKFSNLNYKNGFERSVSAAVVQNLKNDEHRQRKISTKSIKEENRNNTFGSHLGSTPSFTGMEQMSSNSRLNRFHQARLSQRPKRSPSTSSFQYISTPYHGSTLSTLQPLEFASHLSLKSMASTFNPMSTCRKNSKLEQLEEGQIQEQTGCKKFFDLSLLADPAYLIILISNCTNAIGYTNFIILLPSYAITLGFDKDLAAYLLSIVSTFDLIGRIGGSALSDANLIPKTWYFVGGLFISGIALFILPFMTSYTWVSVLCSLFGLATGTYVGITAIVMCEMLGTDRLTSSYGISLFVNGILQLIGPPICLSIYERIGKFQEIFMILGLSLLAGSFLWLFMPCAKRRGHKVQESVDDVDIDEKERSLLA